MLEKECSSLKNTKRSDLFHARDLARSRLFQIFLNMRPQHPSSFLLRGSLQVDFDTFIVLLVTSGWLVVLARVKIFIPGVASRMIGRSSLLRDVLSGHPPSPDIPMEQQPTGSPSTAPWAARAARPAGHAFILDLFHICQTPLTHISNLEKL